MVFSLLLVIVCAAVKFIIFSNIKLKNDKKLLHFLEDFKEVK